MEFLIIFGFAGLAILSLMLCLWFISLFIKNSSIVDIFWGTGFVIINWIYFFQAVEGFSQRKWIIALLVTIWGLRLSIHILIRNWRKGEDYRYQKFRIEAGPKFWWVSFFQVFLLQGFLMWIISAPLLSAQINPSPGYLTWIDFVALIVWLTGFIFETVGDWQLARFRANPQNKGKLLDYGVWRYSRHPNYFGDSAQWWAYYLFALAGGGYWTIFSPIVMTLFLVQVSGVALLERNLIKTKPGYKEYHDHTSAFIPWLPRKNQKKE